MPETVMEQIISELKRSAPNHYPPNRELKNIRVVGHTPKNDHYTYDIVIDFADGPERLAAKVYRATKCGAQGARNLAKAETENLAKLYEIARRRNLAGIPRPIGDFGEMGAVVAEKFAGLPLQSIIMKAALLPGYADRGGLQHAARRAGMWLRAFHRATDDMPAPFEIDALLSQLEKLCESCRGEGLDDASIRVILAGARSILRAAKKSLPCSAVLNDFTPLNIVVGDGGIAVCDYAKLSFRGCSYYDVAQFMAAVEALEKYPFCNRMITSMVQDEFLQAYGATEAEEAVLRVFKIRALLGMFAQGRGVKPSAVRKKVMWATVMKRFIQQAAQRSLAPAA